MPSLRTRALFPHLAPEERLARLEPPSGPTSLVLDTDTDNEIDDQFALAYAVLSPGLRLEAVYAAPYHNERSRGPGDGMERSYQEILRELSVLGLSGDGFAFRGSDRYLPAASTPVPARPLENLVAKALQPREKPLYVVAIGAITNMASALLLEPEIIRKVVVVWLGGEPRNWTRPQTRAFNLWQDLHAARVVFDSGVPLVHVPCSNVAEHLRTTLPEIERYVRGRGPVGDYLYETYRACHPDHFAYSRVIWDLSAVAYLVNPAWTLTDLVPSPQLLDDLTWSPRDDESRHLVREVYEVDRDAIFGDLFRKLERGTAPPQSV